MKVHETIRTQSRELRAFVVRLTALLVLPFGCASATDIWHSSIVDQIYPLADGNFVLIFQQSSPSCTSANAPDYYNVVVGENGMTQEGAKKIFAAASIAFAMGKTLTINFSDSTPGCYVNRALVVN